MGYRRLLRVHLLLLVSFVSSSSGCQFYPYGEYLRFLRVPENTPVGETILHVEVHPRHKLTIQPIDRIDDANYFTYQDVNSTTVAVSLFRSLDDLVDNENPQNVLKFRMVCDYNTGSDTISSYMSVTVYVEDVNDHAPRFLDLPYQLTVDELTPPGLTLFRGIHAVDRDKPNTPNSDVHYSIVGGNEQGKFALESSHRAVLVLKSPLDYDAGDKAYNLKIMASDRGTPPKNTTVSLLVKVSDNDDSNPQFSRDVYKTQIPEFYPITGKKIHKRLNFKPAIFAYDGDLAINTPVRYDIISGNDRRFFYLDPKNGSLFLQKEVDLDRERLPRNTYVLQIQASQIDNPLKTGIARAEVEILDLNDNLPEFEVDLYNISIVENLPNGFSVLQVIATDRDQGDNGEFTYQLEDKSHAFNIDPRSGWLTVRDQQILDREKQTTLRMKVYAKEKVPSVIMDANKKSMVASVAVEVTLLDANDNNPTFVPSNLYEFRIPGDSKTKDLVGQVKAVDPDLGRNGMILYALQRSNVSNISGPGSFSVDPETGRITVAEHPVPQGRHALFVEAADQPANPSEKRFSLAVVTIEVFKAGKGQLVPDFVGAPYEFWVGGDVSVGTSVGQVRVTEAVDKNHIVYDLLHSYHEGVPFAIEERSGVITVVDELKKFDRALYDFEALVTDEKEMTLVTNVTIHVVESEGDGRPMIRERGGAPIELRVRENLPGAVVGQLVRPYESPYSNSSAWWKSLKFIIANQQDVAEKFAISADGTIYTQKSLDREERDVYRLTIISENLRGFGKGVGVYQVTVIVEDENDNPPLFDHKQYEGHIPENSPGGTEVVLDNLIRAKDADSGFNAQFKFTLYGEGSDIFTIDQATGRIFLRKNVPLVLDREEKSSYSLRIVARDKGNLNSEVKLLIHVDDVNDNPPKFLQMVVLHDQDVEIVDSSENKLKRYNALNNDLGLDGYDAAHSASDQKTTVQLPPMISLPETIPVGTSILRLLADDRDANSTVSYGIHKEIFIPRDVSHGQANSNKKHFVINSGNGEVAVATVLTPEAEHRLVISAFDGGGFTDNVTVRIFVKDVNDHAPVFSESSYDFDLLEGVYSNRYLGKVDAIDGDYDENANVTYSITQHPEDFPFRISPTGGEIFVTGDVDRETRSSYVFKVTATDQALEGRRLSSSVDVEVHIADVNDNAPAFYGYDRLGEVPRSQLLGNDHDHESSVLVPIYYTSVQENSPLGTPIAKLYANDSDFQGNGNGLILFDVLHARNAPLFFEIDSKDGIVTITNKLDYERAVAHNLTIVASDLGKPSLSSTALLVVSVLDVPEERDDALGSMFTHRYYEVEIEENAEVPFPLLTVNVSDAFKNQHLRYSISPSRDGESFRIDPANGTLYLKTKPDRETKSRYEIKVRVDRLKKGRGMTTFIYPPPREKVADLAPNEVKIVVRVKDVNDNSPMFVVTGRPIVAAVPRTANYGYDILKLHATDPDEGINGEIRYQIMGRMDDDSHKFSIDPLSGQVRSVVSFFKDAGKVFGFDVRAVDRRGADNGRSAIANIIVYILDDEKQVTMVLDSKPTVVERNLDTITGVLHNVTGLDVRARKIEPRIESDEDDGQTTNVYLYAIDPVMNVLIEMDTLHNSFFPWNESSPRCHCQHCKRRGMPRNKWRVVVAPRKTILTRFPFADKQSEQITFFSSILEGKSREIKRKLDRFEVKNFYYSDEPLPARPRAQRSLLSALEVAVVVLGCVVFVGAMSSAICVACVKRNKRRRLKNFPPPDTGFTLNKAMVKTSHLFPGSAYLDGLCPGDTTDTYVEMHSNKSSRCGEKRRHRHHDPSCFRHHRNRLNRQNSQAKVHLARSNSNFCGFETSMNSLHSSGKDSGITEGRGGICPCGHSTSHSSEDSSNGSYEDSLKSLQRRNDPTFQHMVPMRRASIHGRPRQRQLSQQVGPPPPPPAPPQIIGTPLMTRR